LLIGIDKLPITKKVYLPMTLKSNKCRKGFTVLELILVTIPVAIIGISLFVGLILLIVYLIKHYI
jgi:hypothetical protein